MAEPDTTTPYSERARPDVDRWLASRAPGDAALTRAREALADIAVEEFGRLETTWAARERKDLRLLRAAMKQTEERIAARAAELAGKHYEPDLIATAEFEPQEEDAWRAVLPDGIELGEFYALVNSVARHARLPASLRRR